MVAGPLFLSESAALAACGQTRNFSPIGRKKRPWDALCCIFSGSDGLEDLVIGRPAGYARWPPSRLKACGSVAAKSSRRLHLLEGVEIQVADSLKLFCHWRGLEVFREAVQPGLVLGLEIGQLLHGIGPAPGPGPLILRPAVAHTGQRLSCLEAFSVTALAFRVAQSHGRYVTWMYWIRLLARTA